MKKRVIEWIKSLLIIVLALNAVVLIARLSLSEDEAASLGDVVAAVRRAAASEDYADEETTADAAAIPVAVALTGENGRCGMVDRKQIQSCYSRLTPLIAESLGSAEKSTETDAAHWQQVLGESSIFISYDCTVPMDVLAGWSGGVCRETVSANMLILQVNSENIVCVLYSDGMAYYESQTSASFSAVQEVIASARPNGARFAYELARGQQQWENVAPCSLVVEGMQEALPIYTENTVSKSDIFSTVMEAMELNPYIDKGYTDKDGRDTYLFSVGTLKLSDDGTAIFHAAGDTTVTPLNLRESHSTQEMVELTRDFVQETLLPFCGVGEIGLSSLHTEGNSTEIVYSYYLNGYRVSDIEAAHFSVEKGKISEICLNWRCYAADSATTSLLSPRLECAVYPADDCYPMRIGYRAGRPIWLMEG